MIPSNKPEEIKITFMGNQKVGKSTFLKNTLNLKNISSENSIDRQKIPPRRILNKNYSITINEINGATLTKYQNSNTSELQKINLFIKNSDLVVIVFDVSHMESFLSVGRDWLRIAREAANAKNIALLANKVDRVADMSYKMMYQLANAQGLQVFFASSELDCNKKVLDEMIIWSEYRTEVQKMKKQANIQQQKKGGFFKNLFGNANQNQDEAVKKRLKQLQQISQIRLLEIRKCLRDAFSEAQEKIKENEKSISQKLNKAYKLSTGSSILMEQGQRQDKKQKQRQKQKQKYKQKQKQKLKQKQKQKQKTATFDIIISKLEQKIRANQNELGNMRQYLIKQQQKKCELELKCQQQAKTIQQRDQIIKSNKEIIQKQKKSSLQKIQSMKEIHDKQQQLINLSKKKMTKLQQQLKTTQFNLNKTSLNSIKGQYELAQKHIRINQQLKKTESELDSITASKIFWEVKSLRSIQKQILLNLKNYIEKFQSQQIGQFIKLYQFSLCFNSSFHDFIDNQNQLLIIIQLSQCVLIAYISQPYKDHGSGKLGMFMLWDKKSKLRIYDLNEEVDLWKYDPLCLLFNKGQITVKFTKKQMFLLLLSKRQSLFAEKDRQTTVAQFLNLAPHGEKPLYEIKSLQIFKVDFVNKTLTPQ